MSLFIDFRSVRYNFRLQSFCNESDKRKINEGVDRAFKVRRGTFQRGNLNHDKICL